MIGTTAYLGGLLIGLAIGIAIIVGHIRVISSVVHEWNERSYGREPSWSNKLNLIGRISLLILCDGVGLIIISAAMELSRVER